MRRFPFVYVTVLFHLIIKIKNAWTVASKRSTFKLKSRAHLLLVDENAQQSVLLAAIPVVTKSHVGLAPN